MNVVAPVVREIGELTPEWLSEVLGRDVSSFECERIGTGQMSVNYRVTLDGGETVVVKLAATDQTSRATGVGLGAYEREVRFYQELAERIGGPVVPCHAALFDPGEGWFTLVIEDVAPARQGDQIAGCSVDQARLAMRELARIHAPVFADPQLGATPWLNQESPLDQSLMAQLLPAFAERYADRVAPEHMEVCERLVASLDGWSAQRPQPLGLVHGDYRLDNMLFGEPGAPREFAIVDWQTVSWGPVMTDAAYFLGSGLTAEDRRAYEEELVRLYHEELLAQGVGGFDWEQCWTGYRRQTFLGIVMVVAPAMIVERTERGDDMFMTSLERFAAQVLDLDATELLPAPGTGRPAPLRPEPSDEGRHEPGAEELWNESWYFDAIGEDASLGAYFRLGLYPNLGVSWLTGFVVGPDREAVPILDFEAPLPDGDELAVRTDTLDVRLTCEEPLARYRVAVESADVALDLVWETLGEPYAYRITTRYEIPCRVSGTVRVGDEELRLDGVGQRDHSWGTRDWWSAEWMWSAGHLDDGTRFHAVEFRLPDAPRLGVGYVQTDGIAELDRVAAEETVGEGALIESARIELGADLALAVEPLAFGPLKLVSPDGRETSFPRAMCRVTADDGRQGVAWVEWNLNRSLTA
jgi:Ser/Thr protein kinase RdoA (MazF antagonist)